MSVLLDYLNELDKKNINKQNSLKKNLDKIYNKLSGKQVYIYGAGTIAHKLVNRYNLEKFNIVGFLDQDIDKQGSTIHSYLINNPDILNDSEVDNIIIASYSSIEEITNYLRKDIEKELNIFTLYNEEDDMYDGFYYNKEIIKLKNNLDKIEDHQKLIDLLLYIRNFYEAEKYINVYLEKYNQNNIYKEIKNELINLPNNYKQKFKSSKKTNICLIVLDAVRADHLNCYGYERETTPFLNKITNKGVKFNNAYATSTWTLPSHASMFTNEMPFEHGINTHNSKIKKRNDFLTNLLKERGYQTYGFTNIPFLNERYGFDQGFDYYKNFSDNNYASHTFYEALNKINKNNPFFLFLNFIEAHSPVPNGLVKWGDSNFPRNEMVRQYNLGNRNIDETVIQKTKNNYDDSIFYFDEQLKYYMNFFPDDTVFIITSDHGELFGEGNYYVHDKVEIRSEILRVPLIIYGKNIPTKTYNSFFSLKEIYNLIGDLSSNSKYEFSQYLEKNIFAERSRNTRATHIDKHEFTNDVRAVIDNKYKLLQYSDGSEKLYEMSDEDKKMDMNKYDNYYNKLKTNLINELGQEFDYNSNKKDKNKNKDKKFVSRLESLGYL